MAPDTLIGCKLFSSTCHSPLNFLTSIVRVCLHALADRVIQLPNGLCQFVLQLAPNERVDLSNTFSTWFLEMGDLPSGLGAFMTNTAGSASGAETLVRLFSGTHLESGLLPFFTALREWRREGFLERASITVRRISRDDILCFESFSDGEQMLLGRAALLFLLRKQSDSLLLLDEPETHFNDAWKGNDAPIAPGPPSSTDSWLHPLFRPATEASFIEIAGPPTGASAELRSPDPAEQQRLQNHFDLIKTLGRRWQMEVINYWNLLPSRVKKGGTEGKTALQVVASALTSHADERGRDANSMIRAAVCRAIQSDRAGYRLEIEDSNPPRLIPA